MEANDSFRPENVKSYLRALSEAKGAEVAKNIPAYILIVRAKYLQMRRQAQNSCSMFHIPIKTWVQFCENVLDFINYIAITRRIHSLYIF